MLLYYNEKPGRLEEAVNAGQLIGFNTKPLPPDHPLRRAVEIGQKVLEEMEKYPDRELRDPIDGLIGHRGHHIAIYTKKKQSTGLAWLKSLPVGTRINTPQGVTGKFVVIGQGLAWDKHWGIWYWNGTGNEMCADWRTIRWVEEACPANCPKWEPNNA